MCKVNLYIESMRQKAAIDVYENGSEASAVTIEQMEGASMGGIEPTFRKADFHANRPFIHVISESSTNAILFVGKYSR